MTSLVVPNNFSFLSLGSKAVMTVGEMYFDKAKLKINMDNVGRVGKDGSKKLLGSVSITNKYMIVIRFSINFHKIILYKWHMIFIL